MALQISNPFYNGGNGIGGSSLSVGQGLFSGAANAVNDIFQGEATKEADDLKAQGLRTEATDYMLASQYAGEEEEYTKEGTAVQLASNVRNAELGIGSARAGLADNGFSMSGSSLDIIRAGHQQAGQQQAVTQQQGLITEQGFEEQKQIDYNQSTEATSAASAEESMGKQAETFGDIGAVLQGAGAVASLFI